jgi:hypothetical protein
MAMQMYLVAFNGEFSQDMSRGVQHRVRECGGIILMVMKTGLIAAVDDSKIGAIQQHPDVQLVGGVNLSPRGFAADRLQRIFAENVSKQLDFKTE